MKKSFARNTFWMISCRVIQMIIGFIIGIISARFLGPSNYGVITYVESYISLFTSFCSLGFNSIIIKKILMFEGKEDELFGTAIVLRLISGLFSSISIVMLLAIINDFSSLYIIVAILEAITLIFQAFEIIKYWYLYKLESKKTSILYTIAYVITALYKLFLLISGKSIIWFAFSLSIDSILIAIFLVVIFKKDKRFKFKFSFDIAKNILNDGWHYIISGLMIAIYSQTDKIMLKHFFNEVYVSYYSVSLTITSVISFVLIAVIDSASSVIIALSKKSNSPIACERRIKQLYCFVFWFSILWSSLICVFSDYIISILYGVDYLPCAPTLKILVWEIAFSYIGSARNSWILINNKEKIVKHLAIIGAGINIVLNLMFIPIMNSAGAAVATLISEFIVSIVLQFLIPDLRRNGVLVIEGILFIDVINKNELEKIAQKFRNFLNR